MNPIKSIRLKLGLTQAELAAALDVSQSLVSQYERGNPEMPPATARRLIQFAQTKGKRFTFNDIYAK
ncbi:helix-turn-helix protein [compost metagenome]